MPTPHPPPSAADRIDDYLVSQIGRIDEEIEAMKKANAEAIATAVEDGIMRAVANPALWLAASTAIQAQAKARAGGWLLGSVGALFSRAGWLLMALVAVYTLGGWGAVVAMLKAWLSNGGQS